MSLCLRSLLLCVLAIPFVSARGEDRPVADAEIARLIRQLGSDEFEEREKAARRLEEIGAPAWKALRRAAERDRDAEVRSRAAGIVQALRPRLFGPVRTLNGHAGQVNGFSISADGKRLLSGGLDGTARLWDLTAGTEIERMAEHEHAVWGVALSPDGKRALYSLGMTQKNGEWLPCPDHDIRLWDVEKHRLIRLLRGHTDDVRNLAFTADGRSALSGSRDATMRLWDLESGDELRCFEGHDGLLRFSALSADERLAVSSGFDQTVRCWDVATGEELARFIGHESDVHGVAFLPDGKSVVSGGTDKRVRMWDVMTGRELRRFEGHTSVIWPVAASPDGGYLLSAGGMRNRTPVFYEPSGDDQDVRLWDATTGEELHRYEGHMGCLLCVRFTPDGQVLSCASDGTIRLWKMGLPGPKPRKGDGR
jgi:WD40 repeat protein